MARKFKLTGLQEKTLELFSRSPLAKTFYWTGGTALAYFYLQNRLSYDLDFFSDAPFQYEDILRFIRALQTKLGLKKIEQRKIFDRWEFLFRNHSETRLEFVHYDFKSLKPRRRRKGILVDSLEDMAANKTMALVDRQEPKDAFDIYFLITRSRLAPAKLMNLASKKFGVSVSPQLFWSEAVHKAQSLTRLTPLIFGSDEERRKLIGRIVKYFEETAAREVKKMIGE